MAHIPLLYYRKRMKLLHAYIQEYCQDVENTEDGLPRIRTDQVDYMPERGHHKATVFHFFRVLRSWVNSVPRRAEAVGLPEPGLHGFRRACCVILCRSRVDLRPPTVIRFGLAKAIQMHAESLIERYPQVTWNHRLDQDGQLLPEKTNLARFRICQEAINNIIRHSQATGAWIKDHLREDHVELEESDNGQGFENSHHIMELTNQDHFGLAGIAERVQAIDSLLDNQSQPGDGTTIRVRVHSIANKVGWVPSTKQGFRRWKPCFKAFLSQRPCLFLLIHPR